VLIRQGGVWDPIPGVAFPGRKSIGLAAGEPRGGAGEAPGRGRGGEAVAGRGAGAPQRQMVDSNADPGEGRTRHLISMPPSSPFVLDRLPSSQATF
jgi:hypothetical protein